MTRPARSCASCETRISFLIMICRGDGVALWLRRLFMFSEVGHLHTTVSSVCNNWDHLVTNFDIVPGRIVSPLFSRSDQPLILCTSDLGETDHCVTMSRRRGYDGFGNGSSDSTPSIRPMANSTGMTRSSPADMHYLQSSDQIQAQVDNTPAEEHLHPHVRPIPMNATELDRSCALANTWTETPRVCQKSARSALERNMEEGWGNTARYHVASERAGKDGQTSDHDRRTFQSRQMLSFHGGLAEYPTQPPGSTPSPRRFVANAYAPSWRQIPSLASVPRSYALPSLVSLDNHLPMYPASQSAHSPLEGPLPPLPALPDYPMSLLPAHVPEAIGATARPMQMQMQLPEHMYEHDHYWYSDNYDDAGMSTSYPMSSSSAWGESSVSSNSSSQVRRVICRLPRLYIWAKTRHCCSAGRRPTGCKVHLCQCRCRRHSARSRAGNAVVMQLARTDSRWTPKGGFIGVPSVVGLVSTIFHPGYRSDSVWTRQSLVLQRSKRTCARTRKRSVSEDLKRFWCQH